MTRARKPWMTCAAAGVLACTAALATTAPPTAPGAYSVVGRQLLDGPVRWDYLAVDSVSHRLFLTRGDHVDVFDTLSKSVVGAVGDTQGVHGVALAHDLQRGYTSNGASDSVTVFDLASLARIATIKVGRKPDAIVFDPASKRVFAANAKDHSLSVIDTASNKVLAVIALAGAPETAAVDGKGRLYIALEDSNAIAVVDTGTMTVLRQYQLGAACEEPAGLAIDAAAGRLFAGCHNARMAVVDAATGRLLASPAIGKGNDATAFDPQLGRAFASNGEGSVTVIDGAAPYAVLQTVATMPRARTLALDTETHQVFVVSAEAATQAPAPANGRPPLKAGTFTLLTLAPAQAR